MNITEVKAAADIYARHAADPLHTDIQSELASRALDIPQPLEPLEPAGETREQQDARLERESVANLRIIDRALESLPSIKINARHNGEFTMRAELEVKPTDERSRLMLPSRLIWGKHDRCYLPYFILGERPKPNKPKRTDLLLITPRATADSTYGRKVSVGELGSGFTTHGSFGRYIVKAEADTQELTAMKETDAQRQLVTGSEVAAGGMSERSIYLASRYFRRSNPARVAAEMASDADVNVKGIVHRRVWEEQEMNDFVVGSYDVSLHLGRLVADFGKTYTL